MGDLSRDLRLVWERDYSHLMYRRKDTPRNYFGYKGLEFQLGAIYQTLYVVRQDDVSYLVASLEVKDLKSKHFLNILNPTENELVLFELEYGFEFPFCEKNKKVNQKGN
mgnify:CR=1 FL=1